MTSNLTRRLRRKKQARLTFDPVEPSSSATRSAAHIRYQTPNSRNNPFSSPLAAVDGDENGFHASGRKDSQVAQTPVKGMKEKNNMLPLKSLSTPVASSLTRPGTANKNAAAYLNTDDSGSDIIPSSRRRPVASLNNSSSPLHKFSISPDLESQGHSASGAPTFISARKRRHSIGLNGIEDDSSAGSSPEEEPETARKRARPRGAIYGSMASRSIIIDQYKIEEESPFSSSTRAGLGRGRAVLPVSEPMKTLGRTNELERPNFRSVVSDCSSNSVSMIKKTPERPKARQSPSNKSTKKGKARKGNFISLSSDDDDSSVLPTPRRTRGTSNYREKGVAHSESRVRSLPRLSKHAADGNFDDENTGERDSPDIFSIKNLAGQRAKDVVPGSVRSSEMDSDEDGIVQSSPIKRRRKRPDQEDDSPNCSSDEDEEPVVSSPLRRRRVVVEVDSDSDIFESPSNLLRSGPKGKNKAKKRGKTDGKSRELGSKATRLTRGQQQRQHQMRKRHRTVKEKKFELLRRQRAGEKITEVTSSESDDEPQQGLYDSDSEHEVLSEFEDEETEEGIEEVRQSLRPNNRNNDDDDFIVADEEEPLGVPGHGLHDIPLEFTHQAHKPLKEHFKDAIEWLVQKKVNPAFNQQDPVYVQAFKKLNTEVKGYAVSKYISSVWRPDFRLALQARPLYLEQEMDPDDLKEGCKCDACGRTNHPARHMIQFGGRPYHENTLDEVEYDDEEEEEEDSVNVNSNGEEIPGEDKTWSVGSHCRANAETAHSLIHWKHALNVWVLDQLKSEGHLSPAKLAQREEWSKKKRSNYANSIVDHWHQGKQIKDLYRDFKANLEAAREGKQGRWATR